MAQREFQLTVCRKLADAPAQQSGPLHGWRGTKGQQAALLEEPPRDGAADEPMGLPWACVGGGGRQENQRGTFSYVRAHLTVAS